MHIYSANLYFFMKLLTLNYINESYISQGINEERDYIFEALGIMRRALYVLSIAPAAGHIHSPGNDFQEVGKGPTSTSLSTLQELSFTYVFSEPREEQQM